MDKFNYKILREIGKGSFGRVYKARKVRSDYAIKKVRCDAPENVELALQEFWTLSCLKAHNNIIRFEECYLQHGSEIRPMKHGDKSSPSYMYLVEMAIKGKRGWDQAQYYLWFVMEYCNCGDMNDYILDRDPIPYLNTIFMVQLADGISFLHKSNVVHRDLKPENVLVRSRNGRDPVLKIADFGLSKVCNHPIKDADQGEDDGINVDTCWLSSACGSDFFMAPEVFEGRYTAKADVFALGIMFWAIMDRITFIDAGTKKVLLGTYVRRNKEVLPVGEALLDDPNLDMTQLLVDTGQGPAPGQRSKRSHSRSCVAGNKKKLRDLIAQMVHPNPEFRPSSQELLGRLGSILQPNERPKGLRLNTKKPNLAKNDFHLLKTVHADAPVNQDVLSNHSKNDVVVQGAHNSSGVEVKKDVDIPQNEDVTANSRPSLSNMRRRKPGRQNVLSQSNNSNVVAERKSEKSVASVAKARRKALAAVKKRRLERTVTRNLRSAANLRKLADGAKEVTRNEQETDSTKVRSTISAQTCSEESSDSTEPPSSSKVVHPDVRECLQSFDESSQSNLESCSKVEDDKIPSSRRQVESDDGADFLVDTDADSRDSSIVSEIPEFDSGYKSKRSRRVSNIADQTEENMVKDTGDPSNSNEISRDEAEDKSTNSATSREGIFLEEDSLSSSVPYGTGITDKVSKSPSLYYWRHNGLKEQIRACKANADSEHRREAIGSKYSFDPSAPQTIVSTPEREIPPKTPVALQKPKLEVPRTPCVVMQSKAKIRHNPFHTAVKKRWKYVVLDEYPPPSAPEITSSTVRETKEDAPAISKARVSKAELNPVNSTSNSSVTVKTMFGSPCKSEKNSLSEFPCTTATGQLSTKLTLQQQKMQNPPVVQAQRPSSSSTGLREGKIGCNENDLSLSLSNYKNHLKIGKMNRVASGKGKQQFECSLAPWKRQRDRKSAEMDELQSAVLHKADNTECQSNCCKVKPSQIGSEMLQHLSRYWYPGKGIPANGHKAYQPQSLNQGVDFLRSRCPSDRSIQLSSRIAYAAAQGTSGVDMRSKANVASRSIPTIDLTQDGDCVPLRKKPRYEDDGYSSAHKSSNSVVRARKFQSTSFEGRGSKPHRWHHTVRENSVDLSGARNSTKRKHIKAAVSNDLSSQRYNMLSSHSHRHPDIFRLPHTIPNSSQYRDAQLGFQHTLQMSSPTAISHNSLLASVAGSSIGYLPYGQDKRGFSPLSQPCYEQRNISTFAFPPYSSKSLNGHSQSQRRTAKLPPEVRNTVKLPGGYAHQSHLLGSERGGAMPRVPQNLVPAERLDGTVSHQMRNLYSPPPLIPGPIPGLVTPYNDDSSPSSNFCSVESNMLTLTSYPCHLQHSKPILNN